ncbi:hypothetical protein OB959_10445 [Aeromonas bestiarum]|uniref:Lipoprotein n=2 Tax=Aeromonas bestiarum TaxID=105751 RepID=A0AAW7HWE1_9GAMM|nr:hypothetical protein [Aeromonas bestiarum]MDM5140221.1 hypothetical protein [Aeromonas bestiarum]
MRMHHKAMLAIACTAALSACDSEKAANSIAKRAPLPLPDAGVYEANLLSRDGDQGPFKMIKGPSGLALVYPKGDSEQRWGVWVENDGKPVTSSQWTGQAAQKENKDGIYPVLLERTSVRGKRLDAQSNDHNLISFQDKSVTDLAGKEVKRWTFDFTRVGTQFRDPDQSTALYRDWSGQLAVSKLTTRAITSDSWLVEEDAGLADAMVGLIRSTNNGGSLTLDIEFPRAGCTLTGKGKADQHNGLSKLSLSGFGKCSFKASSDLSPLENKWVLGLAKARDGAQAYAAAFEMPGTRKATLVVGFPEQNGLMMVGDKQP